MNTSLVNKSSEVNKNWEAIRSGQYLNFATRKRSGEFVETPVWFAPMDDCFVVFSAGNAGKVKRLRNFSESRIAPCSMTGEIKGPWVETRAFLLHEPADKASALQALRKKYGWLMWTGDFFATLAGKKKRRAYIRIQRHEDHTPSGQK